MGLGYFLHILMMDWTELHGMLFSETFSLFCFGCNAVLAARITDIQVNLPSDTGVYITWDSHCTQKNQIHLIEWLHQSAEPVLN